MAQEDRGAVELRLRAAVESAPSGLLMSDSHGRIVLVNREIERLFGYAREELLGKSVDMLVPERFREGHPSFRAGFLNAPSVRAMGAGRDLFGRRKDGSEVPVEIGLTPIATAEGLFVLSSIVDISERKRAEERFRAAVEASPSGVVMVDATGVIILVNRETERLFGYAREELLGQSLDVLIPPTSRAKHPRFREAYFRSPGKRAMGEGRELYGVRKDGVEIPVEIGLNPIETAEGLVVLASVVDITTRKRAEEERRQLESQLRHAQKMEAVGALAGGIAHDFNNILGAIIGFAELLRESVDGEEARHDLQELLRAAARGRDVVERILAFSRRQEPERRPIALDGVVSEATKLLRASLPPSIELRVTIEPNVPRVAADSSSVHQAIMNLATNAAHAMPHGGRFDITLESRYVRDSVARANPGLREGQYAVLVVRDSGFGMTPAVRERALEPFFTTKQRGAGTGLGLALVDGIMREHDGAVQLESEEGKGTTVRCLFPALTNEPVELPPQEASTPRGTGQRILLVDDEPSLAAASERRLKMLGYDVVRRTDSVEALAAFRATPHSYDLVVTDYWMPQLTGLDLATEITAIRPDVPIVLLTGFMEQLPPEALRTAGIREVLTKPLTLHELGIAVDRVLNGTRNRAEPRH